MEKELQRQKKTGKIDFIKAKAKEFILYDFESKKFSIIFYDNKYRQDSYKLNTEKYIYEIERQEKLGYDMEYYKKLLAFWNKYN